MRQLRARPGHLRAGFFHAAARLTASRPRAAGRASARLLRLRARPVTGDNDTRTWMTLSYKQVRFIDEYMIDLNGCQAALRAGYSWGAARKANRILAGPAVKAEIAARTARLAEQASITVAETVEQLAAVVRANMRDYLRVTASGDIALDLSRMSPRQASAVQHIEIDRSAGADADGPRKFRLRLFDKIAAADKLLRHLGAYRDRVEHSGPEGGPIEMSPPLTDEQRLKALIALIAQVRARRQAEGDPRDPEQEVRAALTGAAQEAVREG